MVFMETKIVTETGFWTSFPRNFSWMLSVKGHLELWRPTRLHPHAPLKQDPLDLSFWSFLPFFCTIVERHLLWKFHKTIQRKSWSNVPLKLLACIRVNLVASLFLVGLFWKTKASERKKNKSVQKNKNAPSPIPWSRYHWWTNVSPFYTQRECKYIERAAIFFFFFFFFGESRQTNARARRETKKQQGSPFKGFYTKFYTYTIFMKLGTLVHHVRGYKSFPRSFQYLPCDLVMVFQIRKNGVISSLNFERT